MSCGMCAHCGGMTQSINYAKQIDPPTRQYGTILGDAPQESYSRRHHRNPTPAIQMCLPTLVGPPPPSTGHHPPGQQPSIIQVPCDPQRPCPKFVCGPCPPPPPTKVWLIKSSPMPQKPGFLKPAKRLQCRFERVSEESVLSVAAILTFTHTTDTARVRLAQQATAKACLQRKSVCLPVGGSEKEPSPFSDKIMVCVPCAPVTEEPKKPKKKLEPVGLISRNKEMDLIAGKLVSKCTCGRMNGLAGEDCPRVSCQNNPGCTMRPPRCWPQFKEPEPEPPPPPDQELLCVPIQLVYEEPPPPS